MTARRRPKRSPKSQRSLYELGCYEISLGDTIGAGTPETIGRMLDAVLDVVPAEKVAGHYHDTKGRALENIEVSLEKGLRTFDSTIGGLGGCPYAPGAKGNVATEAVAELMQQGF
jgi:hydroxymethylglutaryl-CoA lyase